MKCSIVVPTYNDPVALELILKALTRQRYKNFEVMVAEDAQMSETKEVISKFDSFLNIKHFTQEDKGNRKAVIINKALPHTTGEYIIFIDGDVIPYSTFIESHIKLAKPKQVLCGRRVNLGDKVSQDLRGGKIEAIDIEKNYFKMYKYLNSDNIRHYEQGIYIKPDSWIYKIIQKRDKNVHILGSNFSCFRDDIFAINGFDEDIVGVSKDDVDLEWRFIASGCKLASCKFSANLFHLNHSRNDRSDEIALANKQMEANRRINRYICKNGIEKLI